MEHACVPLGWYPVRVGTMFYPGYSAEMQDNSWVPPLWLGSVHARDLSHGQVRVVASILNRFVQNGLLESHATPRGNHFHLTLRGMADYFDRNDFGNNPDHLPYLCYSKVVPQSVVRFDAVPRSPRDGSRFTATFTWTSGAEAPWVDAFLRAHAIVLAPTGSPATAVFVRENGEWQIVSLSQTRARIANPTAWH